MRTYIHKWSRLKDDKESEDEIESKDEKVSHEKFSPGSEPSPEVEGASVSIFSSLEWARKTPWKQRKKTVLKALAEMKAERKEKKREKRRYCLSSKNKRTNGPKN